MKRTVLHTTLYVLLSILLLTAVSCDQIPADATLNITSPKNGDRWVIGDVNGAQIAWDNNSVTGSVIIALIDDNDSLITVISDTSDANDRFFYWTVPDTILPASKYHVLITSDVKPEITSLSGAVRIDPSSVSEDQSLEVTYPGNGDEWQAGKFGGAQVRWDFAVASGLASLTLCKREDPVILIADTVSIADGVFTWTVPDTTPLASDYEVLIRSLSDTSVFDYSRRFKVVELDTSQYLELLEPDGQTTWQSTAENGAMIRWDSNRIDGNLRIVLYQQGDSLMSITDGVPVSDGMFTWTVPVSAGDGNGFQVYIESIADPSFNVMSSRFRIDPFEDIRSIDISTPSSGDRWDAGVTNGALVEWSSTGLSGTVHIDLFQNDAFFMSMGTDVDVTQGHFTWTVPSYLDGGSGFEVYIESDEDPLINAFSSSFRINPSELSSTIEVTSPKNGDKWKVLEENGAVIEWTSENLYDSLRIDLYHNRVFVRNIAEHVAVLDGSYTWTVPFDVAADKNYEIYLESELLSVVNTISDDFTIEPQDNPPVIELTSPSSGIKWDVLADSAAVIEWTPEFIGGTVHIDLYHKGEFVFNIATDVPVLDNSYKWTVPVDIPPDRNYEVYIESDWLSIVNDMSADITIEGSEFSPSIEVDIPDNWTIGEVNGAVTTWTTENLTGTLNLKLFDNGDYVMDIADEVPVDSLHFNWTVPGTIEAGNKYSVQVQSNLYPLFYDVSKDFKIQAP